MVVERQLAVGSSSRSNYMVMSYMRLIILIYISVLSGLIYLFYLSSFLSILGTGLGKGLYLFYLLIGTRSLRCGDDCP